MGLEKASRQLNGTGPIIGREIGPVPFNCPRLVRDHFSAEVDSPFALTEEETAWLKQVNEVPRAGVRERWRELDGLRRAGQLDQNQLAEMTKLYDQIEATHTRRIQAAAELAKLWHVSLDSVIDQLGLSPSGNDD